MRLHISDYTNLPPILHRFRNIAFDRSKIATPFVFTPSTEGFLWDDFREILPGCQWMAKVRTNGIETLPKILIA